MLHEVRVAPTLVKYADPNEYEMATRGETCGRPRSELMKSEQLAPSKAIVDLLDEEPLEVEIATTLLYEHSHFSYRQIRQALQVSGERYRREIIDLGLRHRGKHDENAARLSAPDSSSASTSSWTRAGSATCTATAAAFR